jgi:GNAT superfamily N-acetyltransferase
MNCKLRSRDPRSRDGTATPGPDNGISSRTPTQEDAIHPFEGVFVVAKAGWRIPPYARHGPGRAYVRGQSSCTTATRAATMGAVTPRLDLHPAATPADRAFIVDMARHACVIEDWPLPDPDSDDVADMLPGDDGVTIIATHPETTADVGAVWTFRHDPPLITRDVVVLPEVAIAVTPTGHGHGVGAALLDALTDRCTGLHPALSLNVHRRNPAQRLYHRAGFRPARHGRGNLAIAMTIDLPRP